MRLRTTLLLALFLSVPALAEEPASATEAQKPVKPKGAAATQPASVKKPVAGASEKIVFTNDDLERKYGPSRELPPPEEEEADSGSESQGAEGAGQAEADQPPETVEATADAPPEEQAPAEPDALQQIADEKAEAVQRRAEIAAAESKVESAKTRIADLEKRVLALRNPLLARPAPPEKEREEWDRADTGGRVDRSLADLEQARSDLATAEDELARARSAP